MSPKLTQSKTFFIWMWVLLVCLVVSPVMAEVSVPALSSRVTDLTGTISDAQRATLEGTLKSIEEEYGSQMAVLIVPSTQPETIEQYSIRVVDQWKLGKKGEDKGLLLLVAKNERKVRIEVGYGLEGVIPDALAWRVIDETITPRFKQGDFAGGIQSGAMRLAGLIAGKSQAVTDAQTDSEESPSDASSAQSIPELFTDETGSFSDEQRSALTGELTDYEVKNGKHIFVLVVPTTQPETAEQYAQRLMKHWEVAGNLDVDRSVLLLVAKDVGVAHILPGPALRQRIKAGAIESAIADSIEPQLGKGELIGAVQTGVRDVEKILDDAAQNMTFSERTIDEISQLPLWFLLVMAAFGTVLRWFLGPLGGGLVMGGITGGGAWFISETIEIAFASAAVGFLFVLVGIMNWLAMGFGAGSSGGGGGGFSGGGGGFGGGGASGGW